MIKNDCPQEAYVKIEYDGKVKSKDLAKYLSALSDEYRYFIKEKEMDKDFSDELYIKEIEKGSIEIFFSPEYLAGVLPIISDINTVFDFISYIGMCLNYFKLNTSNVDLPINRIKNYKNINGIVNDGNVKQIQYIDNRGASIQIINKYGKEDGKIIETNIQKKLEAQNEVNDGEYKSIPFYWKSADFGNHKKSNFKGICENISTQPFNVIFDTDEIGKYMTADSHLDKPWQDLIYVVDVNYSTVKGKGLLKIMKVYEDQTYFQSDE